MRQLRAESHGAHRQLWSFSPLHWDYLQVEESFLSDVEFSLSERNRKFPVWLHRAHYTLHVRTTAASRPSILSALCQCPAVHRRLHSRVRVASPRKSSRQDS